MSFNAHHLTALSRDAFPNEKYVFGKSIEGVMSDFRENCSIVTSVCALLKRGVHAYSPRITNLYTTDFSIPFKSIKDKMELKKRLQEELAAYVQAVANHVVLVVDLARYCGENPSCDRYFKELEKECHDLQIATGIEISFEKKTFDWDIPELISRAVAETKKTREDECARVDEVMTDLRFKNHTCPVCRYRPALYYATPCMHPCFCYKCMNEIARVGSIFSHCFICKQKVSEVQPLAFLNLT